MIEQLFGSKTRVKLLQLFYSNPNRSFYVREITRKIDEQINSVRRELSNLLSIGIIVSDSNNNKLYYEVNQKYKFYDPLHQIFSGGVTKTTKKVAGDSEEVATSIDLSTVGHIELAVFTGQFTRDESSGIDLLIVGDVNPNALQKYVDELEKKENKSIRYSVMSLNDFKYRQGIHDRFAISIIGSKKQVLVDVYGLLSESQETEEE
ncbi:MAG TPA: transcriptional regulator [Candidatus Saccharimonadales bacterium]